MRRGLLFLAALFLIALPVSSSAQEDDLLFMIQVQVLTGADASNEESSAVQDPAEEAGDDSDEKIEIPEETFEDLSEGFAEEIAVPAGADEDTAEGFIAQAMSNVRPGPRSRAQRNIGNRLTGSNYKMYTALRDAVTRVANGEATSTIFQFDCKTILDKTEFTAEDLGLETVTETVDTVDESGNIVQKVQVTAEAKARMTEKIKAVEASKVVNCVFADCPFELYWQNKNYNIQMQYPGLGRRTEGDKVTLVIMGDYKISLAVSTNYTLEGASNPAYEVNPAYGQSVQQAVSNARAILDQYASASDTGKIRGFFKEIIARTSYNYSASGGGALYGNPWQMIWVFDDDTTNQVVCEGYSKAFQFLCDHADFEDPELSVISPTGKMKVDSRSAQAHMWNIVHFDGKNYLLDITNCDAGTIGAPDLLYMRGTTEGSVEEGYSYKVKSSTMLYTYDATSLSMYETADLEIQDQWLLDRGRLSDTVSYNLTRNEEGQVIMQITGGGEIPDFPNGYPWADWSNSIVSCEVGEGITRLSTGIFKDSTLREIQLPDSLVTIGDEAFSGCRVLKVLQIPENVQEIGRNAFYSTRELTELRIPRATQTIGAGAFTRTGARVTVAEDNPVYAWTDGLLIHSPTMTVIRASGQTEYVIPEGILTLDAGAFYGSGVVTLTLPSTLKEIPQEEFAGCSALRRVTLAEGLETIGEGAFRGSSLEGTVTLPLSVKTVGAGAFDYTNLETLVFPGDNTELKGRICSETVQLQAKPDSQTARNLSRWQNAVWDIGNPSLSYVWAFRNTGEHWTEGYEAVADASVEEWLVLKACTDDPEGTISIPSGVAVVGEKVFAGKRAAKVTLPENLTVIEDGAFSAMKNLTEINLPGSIRAIGANAFADCVLLGEVTLPAGLKRLGDLAFSGCDSLAGITLPDSMTAVGAKLFGDATKDLYVRMGGTTVPLLGGNDSFVDADHPVFRYRWMTQAAVSLSDAKVETAVTEGLELVRYTGSETSLTLKDVVSIAPQAFCWLDSGTSAWQVNTTLEKLVCPAGLVAVGQHALRGASALHSVTLPSSLELVGMRAFEDCPITELLWNGEKGMIGEHAFDGTQIPTVVLGDVQLETQAFSADTRLFAQLHSSTSRSLSGAGLSFCVTEPADYVSYRLQEKEQLIAVGYDGEATVLQIPEGIEGIGEGAFENRSGLTEVHFPETLQAIHSYAFRNCPNLSELNVPDSVTVVGEDVMTQGKLILPDNLETLGAQTGLVADQILIRAGSATARLRNAAREDREKAAFTDPDDGNRYAWLEEHLYLIQGRDNTALRRDLYGMLDCHQNGFDTDLLVLPDGMRELWSTEDKGFFAGDLTAIVFPEGLTEIPANTAADCAKLETVAFPRSVTTIDDTAFGESLTTVYGYTGTEAEAFAQSRGLTFIEITGSLEDMIILGAASEPAILHVGVETDLRDLVTIESPLLRDISLSAGTDDTDKVLAGEGTVVGEAVGACSFRVWVTGHEGTQITLTAQVYNNVEDFDAPENAFVDIRTGKGTFAVRNVVPSDSDMAFVWDGNAELTGASVQLEVTEKGNRTVQIVSHNGIVRSFTVTGYETLGSLTMSLAKELKAGQMATPDVRIVVDGMNVSVPSSLYTLKSSDESILTVKDGVVYAGNTGTATLTARHLQDPDGREEKSVTVTVTAPKVFQLPQGLLTIEEEAFAGIRAEKLVIPEGTESIGAKAFADAKILLLVLPASLNAISDDAFEGTDGIQIICPSGSYAEQYAREHGLAVIR